MANTAFPVVSMRKFTLLFFTTMGFYYLFWFYNCWQAYQRETNRNVMCLARTFFAVFFVHELFAQVDRKNQQQERPFRWSPVAKAWVFIVGGILEFPLYSIGTSNHWDGPTYALMTFALTLFVKFYALYTAQLVINRNAGDPFGKDNAKLSVGNRLAMILGLYVWFNIGYNAYLELTGQLPENFPTAIEALQRMQSE